MGISGTVAHSEFELGRLYFERCDFVSALTKLRSASSQFLSQGEWDLYLKCESMLLRIYAEMEDHEQIRMTKEKLHDLALNEGFHLNAKTYYTLGICASYRKQFDVGLEYFQKSLSLALSQDNKTDICYAINGLAVVYYRMGRYSESLKEIYNLKVFFQVLPMSDLQIGVQILNGSILCKLGKSDQAIEVLSQCYDLLRSEKNLYLQISLLYALALAYTESGDKDMARFHVQMASRLADPKNLVWLTKQIDQLLLDLGVAPGHDFDIIYDAISNSVTEKKKGKVDFKNQFILLDLLRLFMRNPGYVYSKEHLVKHVWKQDYSPAVHDNKIYVTIKRLRKLIEPDYDKPKYIFRAKNGYYFNKNIRIHLES